MDIMMFLCKSLHIIALSFITIIFLYRLHSSKTPDDTSDYFVGLHSGIVNEPSIKNKS